MHMYITSQNLDMRKKIFNMSWKSDLKDTGHQGERVVYGRGKSCGEKDLFW